MRVSGGRGKVARRSIPRNFDARRAFGVHDADAMDFREKAVRAPSLAMKPRAVEPGRERLAVGFFLIIPCIYPL
jgi:hypothetical protein